MTCRGEFLFPFKGPETRDLEKKKVDRPIRSRTGSSACADGKNEGKDRAIARVKSHKKNSAGLYGFYRRKVNGPGGAELGEATRKTADLPNGKGGNLGKKGRYIPPGGPQWEMQVELAEWELRC